MLKTTLLIVKSIALLLVSVATAHAQSEIVRDAEYYILEAQHGDKWAVQDKEIDAKLAEFREKNGGKPPNIFYILIDDIGFGDLGSETLNAIRGYRTPSINKIAREGMRLARMYTEPSCTPTRVAFMTGRQP
ncbi:MAG: sulfatase-like hydrolase/transferase, partial [Hyphomicrobiales bacterium]